MATGFAPARFCLQIQIGRHSFESCKCLDGTLDVFSPQQSMSPSVLIDQQMHFGILSHQLINRYMYVCYLCVHR